MSVHVLHLADEEPTFTSELGSITMAAAENFPTLNTMSIARVTLAPGAFREPHWTVDANAGDTCFMPRSYPHHIENLDDTQTHFADFFDQAMPSDIGFTGGLSSVARRILAPTLGLREADLPEIPDVPVDLMIVEKVNPVDPVTADQQA